jgi:pimeloyl-ACP methyl ester carboxylesterase
MKTEMEIDLWRTDSRTINGFNQFYRDWQPGDEPCLPVLALHGSLTQSGMWIAPAEAAGSIRMLCPDQRRFGLSNDPGGESCAEFASDALALAQNLLPERYVIMGHSFACSITLEAARIAAGHVAAVVLVDPVVPVGTPSAVPAAPSTPPPETFATLEEAECHFRSGPCFAVPHSPWPRPFAPRTPPQPRPLCSPASLLLRAGPTSPSRSSSATASGLPDAIPATTGGDSDGDLPVPGRKASAHARVYDDAGLARVLR